MWVSKRPTEIEWKEMNFEPISCEKENELVDK